MHPFHHVLLKDHESSSINRLRFHCPQDLSGLTGSNPVNNPSVRLDYVVLDDFNYF
jgi:hypothetical protein